MEVWTCGGCGGTNPVGTRFCGHCGAPAETAWSCPACSAENPAATRFCGQCGTARQAATAPPPVEPPAPLEEPEPEVSKTLRSFVATQVADRLIESGGTLPEERRLISALFADVSGFTTLADRLDPEDLLAVIDPVIAALSSVVARYEGYVEKFAGDALLALFGAPVSHEDDAHRALHVALEMHEELGKVCAELGPDASGLTLHVGVNSGHGIARVLGSEARMDYAVLGDSVILAQRLESAAPPGETYVSDLTRQLTADEFDFESVGELTLKGKLEAVSAYRLLRPRAVRGAARAASAAPLVGREQELAAIEQVLDRLAAGAGGLVAVVGEAGAGKSRLAEEGRQRAGDRGLDWLETRCLSYGAELAYRPYTDLLRGPLGADGTSDVAALLPRPSRADAPLFARLLELPGGEAVAELEPEAFRRRLHDAFARLLRARAAERPTVLLVDDVHWLDRPSAELTQEVLRMTADAPLVMWIASRPDAVATVESLAGATSGETVQLTVSALESSDIGALVAGMLAGEVSGEVAAFVAERSAGNPFFAGEIVRSLQETGTIARENGSWAVRGTLTGDVVPPTVEGLLASRIDLLPRPASSLLGTASVVGRRNPLRLLRSIGDAADFDLHMERLVQAGFLVRDDDGEHAAFSHALVQEVSYGRLLKRRRRALHRRVADVAEQLYGAGDESIELLARHHYLGETGARALPYLRRAAERARGLFANAEAIAQLERAAEIAQAEPALATDLAEALLELGELRELVGEYEQALALYRQVRDSTHDVRAWRGLAATLRKQGLYAQALEVVNEAFTTPELSGADLAPLWLENGWTLSVIGRSEEAKDVFLAALTAVDGRRDSVVAHLYLQLARVEVQLGDLDSAVRHSRDAEAILEEQGDVRGLASTMRVLGGALSRRGDLEAASTALRRGLELAERVGSVEEIGGSLMNLGLLESKRGALDTAIELDRRAIAEFERIGHGSGRAQGYANLAEKLMDRGDYGAALEACERALEVARAIGHAPAVADTIDTMAEIARRRGSFETAAARAAEAAALYEDMGEAASAARALEVAADAWQRLGLEERARGARSRARTLGRT